MTGLNKSVETMSPILKKQDDLMQRVENIQRFKQNSSNQQQQPPHRHHSHIIRTSQLPFPSPPRNSSIRSSSSVPGLDNYTPSMDSTRTYWNTNHNSG